MKDIFSFFEKRRIRSLSRPSRSRCSPEKIREWSHGEGQEAGDHPTTEPSSRSAMGSSAAKIFGPVKDYECICGKYKRIEAPWNRVREVRRRGDPVEGA